MVGGDFEDCTHKTYLDVQTKGFNCGVLPMRLIGS